MDIVSVVGCDDGLNGARVVLIDRDSDATHGSSWFVGDSGMISSDRRDRFGTSRISMTGGEGSRRVRFGAKRGPLGLVHRVQNDVSPSSALQAEQIIYSSLS